jgi:uncharacterized membrane protein
VDSAEQQRRDQQVERIIALLLQGGVVLAIVVVLLGAVLYLGEDGRRIADFQVFRGEPWDLRHTPSVLAAAAAGQGQAVIQLGVLILIATPVARVIFALLAFARDRDLTYIVVTAIVLAVLLYGMLGW